MRGRLFRQKRNGQNAILRGFPEKFSENYQERQKVLVCSFRTLLVVTSSTIIMSLEKISLNVGVK